MNAARTTLALILCIACSNVAAHRPSDSHLSLDLTTSPPGARWDIAVRDLELMLGVDANADGTITWGELRARHAAIARHALSHLTLSHAGDACRLDLSGQRLARHGDGVYSVLEFSVHCAGGEAPDDVDYRLFFDRDAGHRGLLKIRGAGTDATLVLSPDRPGARIGPASLGAWSTFRSYWNEGVHHIWGGFDHLLFLLTLLLPAVMVRRTGQWHAATGFRHCALDVTGVVTAFTAAHSLTLMLAVTGWIVPPAWLVEPFIAVTVLLAALNNLVPVWHSRRWLLALGLGLVHGFGFAGALQELGLPAGGMLAALAGFNLGVEAGQLVIVATVLPLAWLVRGRWFYRRVALQTGSAAIAVLAAVWVIERTATFAWPT